MLCSVIIMLLPLLMTQTQWSWDDFTETGQIGDTIGGITAPYIGLLGAGLTFLAFWIQYKTNEQQREELKEQNRENQKQRIESMLFEMIKLHRENVDRLKIGDKSGIDLFNEVLNQYTELFYDLDVFFSHYTNADIYEGQYLTELESNATLTRKRINLKSYAQADMCYIILFYGFKNGDNSVLKHFFEGRYKLTFYENILEILAIKPKAETKWKQLLQREDIKYEQKLSIFKEIIKYQNKRYEGTIPEPQGDIQTDENLRRIFDDSWQPRPKELFYEGIHYSLGQYFRNAFHTVQLIHNSNYLDAEEKRSLVRVFRGQISSSEQYLILLNCLSIFGRIWEFEDVKNGGAAVSEADQLITRYDLIRNIPADGRFSLFKCSDFYPFVDFEVFTPREVKGIVFKDERERLNEIYKK